MAEHDGNSRDAASAFPGANRDPYVLYGLVLPERAQLSLKFGLGFTHHQSGAPGTADVSIILNQITVWVCSPVRWDVFDLRNVVLDFLQGHLALVGYLAGYAYDCHITRILNRSCNIDFVFGIDIPCIAKRRDKNAFEDALLQIRPLLLGSAGLFLARCFKDLVSAMKDSNDTAFYCYRAIESLRHHCAAKHSLSSATSAQQWEKFREVAGCSRDVIRTVVIREVFSHGQLTPDGPHCHRGT